MSDSKVVSLSTELLEIDAAGAPFVTSWVLAQQDGMPQHKNLLELIRTYLSDFEEFGEVAFETRPRNGQTALLNEHQTTLLFTYMRNTELVRKFKVRLVKEFYEKTRSQNRRLLTVDQLVDNALALQRQEREIIRHSEEIAALEDQQRKTNSEVQRLTGALTQMTVVGYSNYTRCSVSHQDAVRLGKRAVNLSGQLGRVVGKVTDARYGQVNAYDQDILASVFDEDSHAA